MTTQPLPRPVLAAVGPATAEIAEMIARAPHLRFGFTWQRARRDDKRLTQKQRNHGGKLLTKGKVQG